MRGILKSYSQFGRIDKKSLQELELDKYNPLLDGPSEVEKPEEDLQLLKEVSDTPKAVSNIIAENSDFKDNLQALRKD